jgi:hypothetical protein
MKGKKNWRLSKTLSRSIIVRPIEDVDVKYVWAAYKKDGLAQFPFPKDLDAPTFKSAFEHFVLSSAHAAWSIMANGRVIGLAMGQFVGPLMIITAINWFPWASRRNIVEGTVHLFNSIRKQFPVIGMANDEHRPLYEACCMHGIMKRVGTSHSMGKMTVFECRN